MIFIAKKVFLSIMFSALYLKKRSYSFSFAVVYHNLTFL